MGQKVAKWTWGDSLAGSVRVSASQTQGHEFVLPEPTFN